MMIIRPGEIWIAGIPFTNAGGSKKRPILVLWLDGNDLVAASVTSATPRSFTDVPIKEWQ
jgi:mRNA interferase MazF